MKRPSRQTLAEIGKKLGKQALEEIAIIVKLETILSRWPKTFVVIYNVTLTLSPLYD